MTYKRIKAALIGLNFGRSVIEQELFAGPGREFVELVGVGDLDGDKADAVAKEFGVRAYHSLGEALDDREVQAVILITGPAGRAKQIEQVLETGRPVMTTKPFETSSSEALRVLRRAQALGIPVFMNSPAPLPEKNLEQIQEWVTEYNLGRAVGYRGTVWCSYREKPDGSWYDNPSLCPAAPIFRLGIYLMNDLFRLLGPVQDVNVLQSRIFTQRPTADNAQLGILHTDGTIGSLYASFCVDDRQFYRNSLEINFERGTVYRNVGPRTNGESGGIRLQLSANTVQGPVEKTLYVQEKGGYPWEAFFSAVNGKDLGETILPEQVAATIQVMELMRERCGKTENA